MRWTREQLTAAVRRAAGHPAARFARRHWIVATAALAGAFLLFVASYALSCGFRGCPSTADIQAYEPREGSAVLDRDGEMLGRLQYVRRVNLPLDSVPRLVRDAFLAVEDQRFYEHRGVDWRSVGRAAVRNVRELGVAEGFSTITMQVVRNAFIPELAQERSFRRKLIELVLARRLERSLSKDRILELYLNVIYLGNGVYGVEAASRDLFGEGVGELDAAEAATLAALPKGPTSYNPRRHPDRALARRNLVLGLMARQGRIDSAAFRRAVAAPLRVEERGWYPDADQVDALDPVRELVDSLLGDSGERLGDVVVHTTLDARAQQAAARAVRTHAARIERRAESQRRREAEVEGAMVALDPRTGAIRALVVGGDYERGGFNRAFDARRQPGSAFKPFVYGAALAAGFTPATLLDDSPLEMELETGETWEPDNFGGEYSGTLTMRPALTRSANAATVRLAEEVGRSRVIAYAHRLGVESPLPSVPALALGAAEVTPLELVTAYAPLANGGHRVTPRLVERVERRNGDVLWQADSVTRTRVLDPRDAFMLTSMLRSVVDRGTGFEVRRLGVRDPVAGKTGTTNDGNDVWFVGYTPTIVAGVWFGYDTPSSLGWGASGGRLAAPAWVDFYRNGWDGAANADWSEPDGLVTRAIDSHNGALANRYCPVTHQEFFKAGSEPASVCREHQASFWDRLGEVGGAIGDAIKGVLGL